LKFTLDFKDQEKALAYLEQEVKRFQGLVSDTFKSEVVLRTPIDKGRARSGWQQRQEGTTQVIENRVPYIEQLERGRSKQASNGFVKQAMTATIIKTKGRIK
jgi:hypothetical protein